MRTPPQNYEHAHFDDDDDGGDENDDGNDNNMTSHPSVSKVLKQARAASSFLI